MAQRAACFDEYPLPGGWPGPVHRVFAYCMRLPFLTVPALFLLASPAMGQGVARGAVSIQVPAVSQLEVVSHESVATAGDAETGVFRIRVRSNHPWKVVLSAASGGEGSVWVRASDDAATYRRLEPGMETVVASGERGVTEVEIEYRRDLAAGTVASSFPLVYTLASL